MNERVDVGGDECYWKVYCKSCDGLLGYARTDCMDGYAPVDEMICYTCTIKNRIKVKQLV